MTNPEGKSAGRNKIERVLDGCALLESWQSAAGPYRGHSLNTFDARRGVWHQTWVDNGGLLLELDGGLEGARMVMRGETVSKEGALRHEIAWEPLEDGRVRQHWRISKDGGETWTDAFIGLYTKVGG